MVVILWKVALAWNVWTRMWARGLVVEGFRRGSWKGRSSTRMVMVGPVGVSEYGITGWSGCPVRMVVGFMAQPQWAPVPAELLWQTSL